MSIFFRKITESIPSLFRGIFSERNSVANPTIDATNRSELLGIAVLTEKKPAKYYLEIRDAAKLNCIA
jgi:hypothetical protein